MNIKPLLPLVGILSTLIAFSANATPITAMTCTAKETGSFVHVEISTSLFDNAANRILDYKVQWGKLGKHGEILSQKTYEQESNMKVYGSDENATVGVNTETLVIPLWDGKTTTGALLVRAGKKNVTLIDTNYETLEKLGCVRD